MKIRNARGITLIVLIVNIIILIIIAGISIASLTSDNGILRQTNTGSSSTTGTKLVEVAKYLVRQHIKIILIKNGEF